MRMSTMNRRWILQRPFLLELFVVSNVAFLAVDVFVAHSFNAFRHSMEWAPIYFSVVAAMLLCVTFPRNVEELRAGRRRIGGFVVGWVAVVVGVVGLLYHLESQFFELRTIQSLVYTAPFVAPLSYAGLGLLLIMNRMVDSETAEWGRWVVFLAAWGVLGNFILTLCDHAQNGFFHATEWIPVWVSAFGAAFLFCAVAFRVEKKFMYMCSSLMIVQGIVGVLGFWLHGVANVEAEAGTLLEKFLYGAPIFAPLLLPNLSLLAGIGLWGIWVCRLEGAAAR